MCAKKDISTVSLKTIKTKGYFFWTGFLCVALDILEFTF